MNDIHHSSVTTGTTGAHHDDLVVEERRLRARLPLKAPIFLPTDAVPIQQRVAGLRRVLRIYEHDWQARHRPMLRSLRDRHRSSGHRRCFVIGNGPSLNSTDLTRLRDEVTFGVNGIFLKFDDMGFAPTYYVVEDHLVAEDRAARINALHGPTRLFPINLAYCLNVGPETILFNHRPRVSYPGGFDFSTDASRVTWAGCTVTFTCLQLAFYFGFREIYLVGVDASYTIPPSAVRSDQYGVAVLDMPGDDPNHFHPDYFGKGRRWHDPQVERMLQAYAEAKRVTEQHGVRIRNATVGGRLEVFERVNYDSLFPPKRIAQRRTPEASPRPRVRNSAPGSDPRPRSAAGLRTHNAEDAELPRILVLDMTEIGSISATGQLKEMLFKGWPRQDMMQVYLDRRGLLRIRHATGDCCGIVHRPGPLLEACRAFGPDVIYYRPVDECDALRGLADRVIEQTGAPVVMHVMDDWPRRLRCRDPARAVGIDANLRAHLGQSAARLSICEAMSREYRDRYGLSFIPMANGVDPEDFLRGLAPGTRRSPDEPFVLRCVSALADDMNFASVCDVARVVEGLSHQRNVRMEIYTGEFWIPKAQAAFDRLRSVSVHENGLAPERYRRLLTGCDGLLLAYNFDEASIRYVRLSLANKLPECLAAGVPLIAYGPAQVATIAHLAQAGVAQLVGDRSDAALRAALLRLMDDPDHAQRLGEKARTFAFQHHRSRDVQRAFASALRRAAAGHGWAAASRPRSADNPGLIGCFPRQARAQLDEAALLARLADSCSAPDRKGVLIDVGAHHGSFLSHFLQRGWNVFAFEPDPGNRRRLLERFGNETRLTVDHRAVSDRPADSVAFYASDESSGISTLRPFRRSHRKSCDVPAATLDEFTTEQRIARVDLLKIDTEGCDLLVLRGIDWDRVRPEVIICEFEDRKTTPLNYTVHDMASLLREQGYTVLVSEWHPVVRYGIRHDWRRLVRYPCQIPRNSWGNLIAFQKPPEAPALGAAVRACVRMDVTPRHNTPAPECATA